MPSGPDCLPNHQTTDLFSTHPPPSAMEHVNHLCIHPFKYNLCLVSSIKHNYYLAVQTWSRTRDKLLDEKTPGLLIKSYKTPVDIEPKEPGSSVWNGRNGHSSCKSHPRSVESARAVNVFPVVMTTEIQRRILTLKCHMVWEVCLCYKSHVVIVEVTFKYCIYEKSTRGCQRSTDWQPS